ncbi:MAG: 30S ribosomal protein S20 [Acidimicrobiales bacterium]
MANIKSQIKRNRQNEKRHERNKAVRSEIITRTRHAVEAVTEGRDDAEEATRAAIKRIDSATSKGVLHKNTAARKKSRLVKRLGRIEAERD